MFVSCVWLVAQPVWGLLLYFPGQCCTFCMGPKMNMNQLLGGGIGWQMYGPRCVVILLLVVLPSDWFGVARWRFSGTMPFTMASVPSVMSALDGPQICTCKVTVSCTQLALIQALLRWRINLYSPFCGSTSSLSSCSGMLTSWLASPCRGVSYMCSALLCALCWVLAPFILWFVLPPCAVAIINFYISLQST